MIYNISFFFLYIYMGDLYGLFVGFWSLTCAAPSNVNPLSLLILCQNLLVFACICGFWRPHPYIRKFSSVVFLIQSVPLSLLILYILKAYLLKLILYVKVQKLVKKMLILCWTSKNMVCVLGFFYEMLAGYSQLTWHSLSPCWHAYLTTSQCVIAEPCHPLPLWGENAFYCLLPLFSMLLGHHRHTGGMQTQKTESSKHWLDEPMSASFLSCIYVCADEDIFAAWFSTSGEYPKAETSLQEGSVCLFVPHMWQLLPPAATLTELEVPAWTLLSFCGCSAAFNSSQKFFSLKHFCTLPLPVFNY